MILKQIIFGMAIVILSIVVQVIMIEFIARRLRYKFGENPQQHHPSFKKFVLTVSAVTFWLLLGLMLIVSMWTFLFVWQSVFASWEESFYFSLVSFTTLGFGDVILPPEWRILAGFVATDGFLIFGLNTAILLEVMMRLRGDVHRR